jgi:hypothetical protein
MDLLTFVLHDSLPGLIKKGRLDGNSIKDKPENRNGSL